MNAFKKNGGFTLVELIVVIAILAILAGVAVPAYSGYISKANKSADDQEIAAIETAISSALAMEGLDSAKASEHFVATISSGKLTVTAKNTSSSPTDPVWTNFTGFYGESCSVDLKYYKNLTDKDFTGTILTKCVESGTSTGGSGEGQD